jgi:hypothetical protein
VVNPLFQESIMTATRERQSTTNGPRLHRAFELSWCQWKLAFTSGPGQPARLRTLGARDRPGLLKEIDKAKRRFGLPDDAAGVSCYEAGRDGFWLHRWLTSQGVANVIVDSASPADCRTHPPSSLLPHPFVFHSVHARARISPNSRHSLFHEAPLSVER